MPIFFCNKIVNTQHLICFGKFLDVTQVFMKSAVKKTSSYKWFVAILKKKIRTTEINIDHRKKKIFDLILKK